MGALNLTRSLPLADPEATWSVPDSQLDAQLTPEFTLCHLVPGHGTGLARGCVKR